MPYVNVGHFYIKDRLKTSLRLRREWAVSLLLVHQFFGGLITHFCRIEVPRFLPNFRQLLFQQPIHEIRHTEKGTIQMSPEKRWCYFAGHFSSPFGRFEVMVDEDGFLRRLSLFKPTHHLHSNR
jgi:hypothetical protein